MERTPTDRGSRSWTRFIPETERDLARYTGAMLYFGTTTIIVAASVIPALAPDNVNFWRLVLGLPALTIGFIVLFATPRLSDRAFYRSTIVWVTLGILVNVPLLQVTPATTAILANMLAPVLYAGYFLKRRDLLVMMAITTVVALEPLYTTVPSEDGTLAAWLAVYIPTIWAVAIALHLQKQAINNALSESHDKALRDPLTGLANLRALRSATDAALRPGDGINAARQYAVMLVDIDNFKSANSLHGHLGGDRALRCIADQLRRVAPAEAVVARVGGDEFAVLLPVVNKQRLEEQAAMFTAAVRAASVEMRLPGVEVDASVGCAVFPTDGDSLDSLMTIADKAMYKEKSSHHARQRSPIVQVVPGESRAAEWIDGDRVATVETVQSNFREWLGHYTLYARFSTLGWLFGCAASGLSLLMPGADHTYVTLAWASLVVGASFAITMMLINPKPLGTMHFIYDGMTMSAIAIITALTGGFESPSNSLIFLFIVFQAWFWDVHKIRWRYAVPPVVLLFPLIYDHIWNSPDWIPVGAAVYATILMSLIVVTAMYFNQVYLRRIQRRAQRLASTDPLTGIPNRRAFNRYIEEQLAVIDRSGRPQEVAIVMIDLDNFKNVNTVHGHRAGDLLLCDIAVALSSVAREEDCVARVGGDEFAAVLPATGIDGARALAERFVNAVSECTSKSSDGPASAVTASAGFALCPLHGTTLDALVRNADEALMNVKSDGKGSARVSKLIAAV
ncbi:MAG: GGDEF domain-containing protein [Solirubrobacterales bacterium]